MSLNISTDAPTGSASALLLCGWNFARGRVAGALPDLLAGGRFKAYSAGDTDASRPRIMTQDAANTAAETAGKHA